MRDFDPADLRWMQQALLLAKEAATQGEVPVGAVLVRDQELLGAGSNGPIGQCDPTAHAEINALRAAAKTMGNYRLPGATLYVTLEPCTMCFGALVHARIARLVFAAFEPRAGVVGSQLNLQTASFYNHSMDVEGGLLEAESSALLRDFFRVRREVGVDFRTPE